MLRALRPVALAEATSFLALLVASYMKHSDRGATGVEILGPIHGALFLAYVALVLIVRPDAGWSNRTTGWILLAAVLPLGGYVFDWWLRRNPPAAAAPG